MGSFGWNLLADFRVLEGVVKHVERNDDDHDWHLFVEPDSMFRELLKNSVHEEGNASANSWGENLMTCEVQPIPRFDSTAQFNRLFSPLVDKHVVVTGAWVEDLSHPVPFSSQFSFPTEIHAITSVQRELPGDPEVREYELFVFCDDSYRQPYGFNGPSKLVGGVFFSGSNRVTDFRMAFPPNAFGKSPRFREITPNPDDFASRDNRGFQIERDGSGHVVVGRIESGIGPAEGFFHGRFQLWYQQPAWRFVKKTPQLRLTDDELVHDVDAAIELRNPGSLNLPPEPAPNVDTTFTHGLQSDTFHENPIARRNQKLLRGWNGRFDYRPTLLSKVWSVVANDVQLGASLSLPQPAVQIVGCADAVSGTRFTYRFTGRAVLVSLFGYITFQWQIAGGRNLRDQSGDGTNELQFTFDYDAHEVPVVTVTVTDMPGQSASDVVDVGFCLSEAARTAINESRERLISRLQLEVELGPALGVVPRGGAATTDTLRNTVRQADELWRLARSAKRAETREDLPHVAKRLEKAMRETQAAAAIGIREWKIASQLRASGQFPEKSST